MPHPPLTESEVLRTNQMRDAIKSYYEEWSPTHCIHVNPCLNGVNHMVVAALVECGAKRIKDRLPTLQAGVARLVLLPEINRSGQLHYHGWIHASGDAGMKVDANANRWIVRGMSNYGTKFIDGFANFRPNVEITHVGEHPPGQPQRTARSRRSGGFYPLKGWLANGKSDGVLWM